jgi:hypothetical protein
VNTSDDFVRAFDEAVDGLIDTGQCDTSDVRLSAGSPAACDAVEEMLRFAEVLRGYAAYRRPPSLAEAGASERVCAALAASLVSLPQARPGPLSRLLDFIGIRRPRKVSGETLN